jgi:hypothetical protein
MFSRLFISLLLLFSTCSLTLICPLADAQELQTWIFTPNTKTTKAPLTLIGASSNNKIKPRIIQANFLPQSLREKQEQGITSLYTANLSSLTPQDWGLVNPKDNHSFLISGVSAVADTTNQIGMGLASFTYEAVSSDCLLQMAKNPGAVVSGAYGVSLGQTAKGIKEGNAYKTLCGLTHTSFLFVAAKSMTEGSPAAAFKQLGRNQGFIAEVNSILGRTGSLTLRPAYATVVPIPAMIQIASKGIPVGTLMMVGEGLPPNHLGPHVYGHIHGEYFGPPLSPRPKPAVKMGIDGNAPIPRSSQQGLFSKLAQRWRIRKMNKNRIAKGEKPPKTEPIQFGAHDFPEGYGLIKDIPTTVKRQPNLKPGRGTLTIQ